MNRSQRITIGTVDELLKKRIINFPQSSLKKNPVKDNLTTDERFFIQRIYPEKQIKIPDFGQS